MKGNNQLRIRILFRKHGYLAQVVKRNKIKKWVYENDPLWNYRIVHDKEGNEYFYHVNMRNYIIFDKDPKLHLTNMQ